MLVGTWCLYLFLWNTQFLPYCTLLNQARLFHQPVPTLWCQEETAPLQLCRAGGQTVNSKSFLAAGVQRQLLWLLFPWPKNHPSITFCLFYSILSWVNFRKHCQLDDCWHAAISQTVSYCHFISEFHHLPFSSICFKSPFMESAGLPVHICMVVNTEGIVSCCVSG